MAQIGDIVRAQSGAAPRLVPENGVVSSASTRALNVARRERGCALVKSEMLARARGGAAAIERPIGVVAKSSPRQ